MTEPNQLQSDELEKPGFNSDQIQDGVVFDDDESGAAEDVGSEPTDKEPQDGKPAEPEEGEDKTLTDYAAKKINKKHFELQETKRENDRLKAEIEARDRAIAEAQGLNKRPEVLPRPEPFDSDEKWAEWEASKTAALEWDANQKALINQQAQAVQQAQAQKIEYVQNLKSDLLI